MEVALIIGGFVLYFLFIIGIVYWARNRLKGQHAGSQHKLSDADLFKMMTQANHFLTVEQLVASSSLDKKEAKARLLHLGYQGVLRSYYDSSGTGKAIYQLKEEVPLIASIRSNISTFSEKEIIEMILLHVDDYQVTVAELVVIFGIDIYEAKALIQRLKKSGHISTLRKGLKYIYVINQSIRLKEPKFRTSSRKSELQKIQIPSEVRIKIPDADIIQLAIDHDGKLTPTLLCLKKKISIDEAKQKLEELYEQGAFVMDVDEKNYVMEYRLRDRSLLG
jgi:predicted transcriptional regulator